MPSKIECPPNRFDPEGSNCVISTRQADLIINKSFKGKKPRQPTFYIKYGPPASGKGGIMEKVLIKDKINKTSLVTVEVDNIIESNPGYISEREKHQHVTKDKVSSPGIASVTAARKAKIAKDNASIAKSKLYWKYRGESDVISDIILNKALLDNFDIAWETTGATIAWTIKEIKRVQKQGYLVNVVYPLVPYDTLIKRSLEREKKTGQTPASASIIKHTVLFAIKNILKLIDHVDNIYLYDNSGQYGDEYVVIEVNNLWDWTSEDNIHGPGLKRNVVCKCDKLNNELSTKFSTDVMNVLRQICTKVKLQ